MNDAARKNSPWMWIGKLAPPQMQLTAARRDALLARLRSLPSIVLTLVVSPPGFGKTTFMSQLRASLQESDAQRAVAWLTLDEADADPNRFLGYVLLALEGAGVALGSLPQRARDEALDPDPRQNVAALLQALQRAQRPVTLMLDDYHLVASDAVDDICLSLLTHAAPWLKLVVASRVRPRWPLASMKARGLLHQVDANDLVLSLSEATEILGSDFDRSALAIIHSRTEGWAVAVQLARLWLARAAGSSHGLYALSGRVADVAEYLAEQIVENLPPASREFLYETSLLARFNAELADEVRGSSDSAAILQTLAPYEALLVPLDAGRSWFRYHMMLSEFLQSRLEPKRAAQIHRSAALWLARQKDWVLAVSHAMAAHDIALAVGLVHDAGGWELVLGKGIQYTQSLLQQFDDLTRRTEPELLLIQAYLHAKLGDEALSFELLRLAQIAIHDRPRLLRDFKVISSMVHVYFDRMDECEHLPASAEDAAATLPDDPLGQATVLCAGVLKAMTEARMETAMQLVQAARTRMRLAGSPLGENYCLMHLAQASGLHGQVGISRRSLEEALQLAETNFGTESSLMSLVGSFRAQHLYWEGRWDEALPLLQEAQETLQRVDGWFDLFAQTTEVHWRIIVRKEGLQAALAVLEATAHLARQRRLLRLSKLVNAWRVDLLSQCGFLAQARQEAQAAAIEEALPPNLAELTGAQVDWRLLEAGTLALARMQMAASAAHLAHGRLDRVAAWMTQQGVHLAAWRLRLLALLARQQAKEGSVATAEIQAVLEPLFQHGLPGMLLEAGTAVVPLLQQLEPVMPQALPAIHQLRFWLAPPSRQRAPFSAKESEVLTFLVAGQSNKSIARSLNVSENTVKFHLKHIFQKLGVESRTAAISAALQQGFAAPNFAADERG